MVQSAFDQILDTRVGYGSYQRIAYFFIGLIAFADEAEIITLSIILPSLKKDWNLSEAEQGYLGSSLFFGALVGSVLIGFLADKIGRKKALLISSGLEFAFGIGSSFVKSYHVFLILRFFLGMMIGCTIPIAPTYITEISPAEYRGKGQVFIQAFFVMGMGYAMILAKIFMTDINTANWNSLLFYGALPSLVVFLGTLFFLDESPRFLIAKGKYDAGVIILNRMGYKNRGESFQAITSEEREDLRDWKVLVFEREISVDWSVLFNSKNRKATLCLLSNWMGLSFNFFGMIFILPLIFSATQSEEGSHEGVNQLFFTLFGEIPAIILSYFIIDSKRFGRKNSTCLSNLLAAIMFALAFILRHFGLLAWLILARVFTKLSFITINPLTAESYPTTYRTLALGITSGIGRIGAAFMPMFIILFFNWNIYLPLLVFGVVSLLMYYFITKIPYETLGRDLDYVEEEEEIHNLIKNTL